MNNLHRMFSAFFNDRISNEDYVVPDFVLESYNNSRKQNLRKLAVFCRVRNVVSKDDETFTHIGDFEDDDKNLLNADHYVMIVFDSEFQTTFYCDSLGWEAPPDFANFVACLSRSFFNQQEFKNMRYAHIPSNNGKVSDGHVCKAGSCSKYYPLQKCGFACGVSATLMTVIAVFANDIFKKMFCPEENLPNIHHLSDISKYSNYFRSVLIKWLVEDICMSDIVPTSTLMLYPNTAKTVVENHEAITPLKVNSLSNDSHFSIYLTEETKNILSSNEKLDLAISAAKISCTCDKLGYQCPEKKITFIACSVITK